MLIKGNIGFKKAIVIDKELLEKIKNIILQYYKNITYEAKLENDNTLIFESLDELTSYENYEKRKIKELTIEASNYFELSFCKKISLFHSYGKTVSATYRIDNTNDSILLEDKLKKELEKCSQPFYYTIITKISTFYFITFALVLFVTLNIFAIINKVDNSNSGSMTSALNFSILSVTIFYLISYILTKLRNILFPVIIFHWGSEVKNTDKMKKIRSNIFWGVIVSAVVGILISKFQ